VVAFKTLPRPQFSIFQQKLFPIYFGIQTALPAFLALTYPASRSLGAQSGIQGTFAESNRWSVLVPLATMLIAGFANMVFIRPATVNIMKERKLQGTRYIPNSRKMCAQADILVLRNKGWKEGI
jgi:hypothetical protein